MLAMQACPEKMRQASSMEGGCYWRGHADHQNDYVYMKVASVGYIKLDYLITTRVSDYRIQLKISPASKRIMLKVLKRDYADITLMLSALIQNILNGNRAR